jgi:hypothetical protein
MPEGEILSTGFGPTQLHPMLTAYHELADDLKLRSDAEKRHLAQLVVKVAATGLTELRPLKAEVFRLYAESREGKRTGL